MVLPAFRHTRRLASARHSARSDRMKHWHRWIVASVLWAAAAQAGDTWQLHPEWAAEFEAQSVSGTMLVYDERAARYAVHDRKRAETPFSPASTFKLFNALAALETG